MNDKYLSVTAMTRYLKSRFDSDRNLRQVFLKGEISNFKAHTTGHLYFTIKDEESRISAIMFRGNASKLNFNPQEGSKVLVTGRISIYEKTGSYQVYVDDMQEDGVGNLYVALEKLKKKLSALGYFDKAHKKAIPKYPKRIGIVTAPTGAAVRDIITTIRRRYPICETILFPTLVQGENAKDSIVKNIKRAEEYDLDTLIVGRGGGSIEDLWPFNEEIVAKAIYDCPIPVISAVGHEVDFTISDFVADLRAPTPTAAAELAVPNLTDVSKMLSQYSIRLKEAIEEKINYNRLYLDSIKSSYVLKNPALMYENKKQTLILMQDKMNGIMQRKVTILRQTLDNIKDSYVLKNPALMYETKKDNLTIITKRIYELFDIIYKNKEVNLNHIVDKLKLLNPLNTLKRGYSISYINDKVISSSKSVNKNDNIKIKLVDGLVSAKVEEVEYGKEI